jgi:hypothetical protein
MTSTPLTGYNNGQRSEPRVDEPHPAPLTPWEKKGDNYLLRRISPVAGDTIRPLRLLDTLSVL